MGSASLLRGEQWWVEAAVARFPEEGREAFRSLRRAAWRPVSKGLLWCAS